MIHNIVIPWGNIDFDVDLRIKEVKGDTIILNITVESGMSGFQVVVSAGLTTNFQHYGELEIEVEDTSGNIFTILQQRIIFLGENIDWDVPA